MYSEALGVNVTNKCIGYNQRPAVTLTNFIGIIKGLEEDIQLYTENIGKKDMDTIHHLFKKYIQPLSLMFAEIGSEIETENLRVEYMNTIGRWIGFDLKDCIKLTEVYGIEEQNYINKYEPPCFTYVIKCNIKDSSYCKIGLTQNIKARLSQLQTSSPSPLTVVASMKWKNREAASIAERELHELFMPYRIKFNGATTEWFEAPVIALIEKYKNEDWEELLTGKNKSFLIDAEKLAREKDPEYLTGESEIQAIEKLRSFFKE